MAARLEREPRLATSLRTANLAPMEFVKFSMKLQVTFFALELAKVTSERVEDAEVSAQDVQLFRQNEKEIRAILETHQRPVIDPPPSRPAAVFTTHC